MLSRESTADVASLVALGLGQLTDPEVLDYARRNGYVLITLDRDFFALFRRTARPPVSILYLRLPNTHRRTPQIVAILSRFLRDHADTLIDGPVFVTVTPETVVSTRGGADLDD